jgi:hypothetical protein
MRTFGHAVFVFVLQRIEDVYFMPEKYTRLFISWDKWKIASVLFMGKYVGINK